MPCMLDRIETYGMRIQTMCNFFLNTIKGSSTDKQDVAGVDMNIILVGMFSATLGRNVHYASLKKFEQTLLHTFSTDIARNGRIVALTGYLVNFINENNALFGSFHIKIGCL